MVRSSQDQPLLVEGLDEVLPTPWGHRPPMAGGSDGDGAGSRDGSDTPFVLGWPSTTEWGSTRVHQSGSTSGWAALLTGLPQSSVVGGSLAG